MFAVMENMQGANVAADSFAQASETELVERLMVDLRPFVPTVAL